MASGSKHPVIFAASASLQPSKYSLIVASRPAAVVPRMMCPGVSCLYESSAAGGVRHRRCADQPQGHFAEAGNAAFNARWPAMSPAARASARQYHITRLQRRAESAQCCWRATRRRWPGGPVLRCVAGLDDFAIELEDRSARLPERRCREGPGLSGAEHDARDEPLSATVSCSLMRQSTMRESMTSKHTHTYSVAASTSATGDARPGAAAGPARTRALLRSADRSARSDRAASQHRAPSYR